MTAIAAVALTLTWQPIAYRSDGGYYEISYATTVTTGAVSTHTVHGITADKNASSYLLNGLTPGQSYRVRTRTYTPARPNQENEQLSDYAQTVGSMPARQTRSSGKCWRRYH